MNEYIIVWRINISANSPLEAAKTVLSIMRDAYSTATIFEVTSESDGKMQVIDATETDGD